jgi:pyruvate dehydrogenase E2 component (dihydrolipoamide acetyltransferase)
MIQTIYLPDIGSDEVEVTEILVSVGEQIAAEQPLITVEGDKASMEIPAPAAGCVQEISIKMGDKVASGSLILLLKTSATVSESMSVPKTATRSLAGDATAAKVQQEEPGDPVLRPDAKSVPLKIVEGLINTHTDVHASPLVRRLAREFGIDLTLIIGSGPKGRIIPEDLQIYVKSALQRTSTVNAAVGDQSLKLLPWPQVDFSQFGPVEQVSLSRINKLTGANLHRNWVQIPHVTQWGSADITELEAFRQQQNREAEQQALGIKLTPLVFIMQAVAKALTCFPRFNSSLSLDGKQLILKKYIHLGIAVDTPQGLVVPVIRHVDQQGIWQLSQAVAETSQRARSGQLTPADFQGGCFTLSSLGGIGGSAFTPIINAPEVAILGISRSTQQPQWDGQQFIPRLRLPLSLSYDHRVIDGAEGARFMTTLEQLLGDIRRLLL